VTFPTATKKQRCKEASAKEGTSGNFLIRIIKPSPYGQ